MLVSLTPESPIVIRGQCCRSEWSGWTTGFGLGGDVESDGNAAGLNSSLWGTLAGVQTVRGNHLLGFYGGYVGNYIGTDANESTTVNGGTFGSYLVGRDGDQYYLLVGGFEFDSYDSRRQIAFANATAEGDTDGWKGYSYLERGMTLGGRWLAVQPFGGLQYVYLRQNGFTETGAPGANLEMSGVNTHSFRGAIGSRIFGQQVARNGRSFTPELRAVWLHEFLETKTGFNTFIDGAGAGSFAINGLGAGRDWALLGTGLNGDLGGGWSAYASYDLLLNDQTTFHVGSGGLTYAW